jgi:hypothetical protein
MSRTIIKYLLIILLTASSFAAANAQVGLCPSNLDFEQGDFAGWQCRAGSAASFPLPVTGPIAGRHTIINRLTAGTDPYGVSLKYVPMEAIIV